MKLWYEPTAQSTNGSWRSQHFHSDTLWTLDGRSPTAKRECLEMRFCQQVGTTSRGLDHHNPHWQLVNLSRPDDTVRGSLKTPATMETLSGQESVECCCHHRLVAVGCRRNRISVCQIVVTSTEPTGSMTGSQRNSIVKKEQGSPHSRGGERVAPPAKLGAAGDPQ